MDNRPFRTLTQYLYLLLFCFFGCGGTWVDDSGNFKRVFGFGQPPDVKVVHSYYWKSPHWTTEYSYFIEVQPSSKFVAGLTAKELMTGVNPDPKLLEFCGSRPSWFLPKPLRSYDAWVSKTETRYRVFQDKAEGTLFVCDKQL